MKQRLTLIEWLVILWVIGFLLAIFFVPYDDTDDIENRERSGLGLKTDNKTGCQYLTNGWSGITPRLDREGNHVGCN